MQKPTNQQELLRLIDRAGDEGWTELDLAGLGLEELSKEIGKCTQLRTLTVITQPTGNRDLKGSKAIKIESNMDNP